MWLQLSLMKQKKKSAVCDCETQDFSERHSEAQSEVLYQLSAVIS